ncbi:MAG TPA: mycofactocin biosynthesis chaperone MftB [Actinomycetales bacterium]|nr:mycofactocin biosynthesis chaperone MftB [Actinomycetales bacterium]
MTSAAAPAGAGDERADTGATGSAPFDLDSGWRLHPGVALRPEPFGALLYHFHTRKLSFLKSPTIVEVVRTLAEHPTARAACAAAGVSIDDPHTARLYLHALGQLADSRMIEPREGEDPTS